MQVELRPLSSIRPYDKNPRDNDAAVDAVAESIRRFGFRQPIVIDGEGVIICGHTRWKAAQKLGLTEVPVHVARDLTPEQIRAYRIADNKTNELATWDLELLPIELADLQGAGIDWSLLGFDQDELAKLMGGEIKAGLTDPDDVPAPPDEAVTQPGDVWILGEHRLMCGDSGSVADVDRLLDGAPIHLVNTDPPYNVKVEPRSNNAIAAGNSSFSLMKNQHLTQAVDAARGDKGLHHHQAFDVARQGPKQATHAQLRPKDRPLLNDFVSDEAFDEMLLAWFGNMARVLLPGRGFYIWGGYANCGNYPPVLKAVGLYFSQAIIWDKQHPVLTRKDFMGAHEWCQPAGTQVLTADGYSSIEAMRTHDRVVGFDASRSYFLQAKRGVPVMATSRVYNGLLYNVCAAGKATWCTAGHHWTVRFSQALADWWCVYLMRRGDWWRVGKSKMLTTWGLGPKQRLAKEKAEEAWILSVHASNVDAMVQEQAVSVRFGIPTTYWEPGYGPARKEQRQPDQIAALYEKLDLRRMEEGALAALAAFQRHPHYPILRIGDTRDKFGRRVGMQVRACNLIPGLMLVPVKRPRLRSEWCPIESVEVQHHAGDVYSLGVPIGEHYVADGIVTHNCFYGWREGAAHVYLGPNNATDLWHVKKINPQQMEHLTAKPAELSVRAMQYSSRPGENVLDLFGGSGSTLIAAEQTGRRAFLMELDPLYCDVICDRFQRFTGKPAVLERTGASPISMKPREENMR